MIVAVGIVVLLVVIVLRKRSCTRGNLGSPFSSAIVSNYGP